MYDIRFSETAERQLRKLDKQVQDRILKVLERIKVRPEDFTEKLIGIEGFKLKAGDYRIFLNIYKDESIILVRDLGHRKNVYKH